MGSSPGLPPVCNSLCDPSHSHPLSEPPPSPAPAGGPRPQTLSQASVSKGGSILARAQAAGCTRRPWGRERAGRRGRPVVSRPGWAPGPEPGGPRAGRSGLSGVTSPLPGTRCRRGGGWLAGSAAGHGGLGASGLPGREAKDTPSRQAGPGHRDSVPPAALGQGGGRRTLSRWALGAAGGRSPAPPSSGWSRWWARAGPRPSWKPGGRLSLCQAAHCIPRPLISRQPLPGPRRPAEPGPGRQGARV